MRQRKLNAQGIFRRLEQKLVEEFSVKGVDEAALHAVGKSFCKNLHSEVSARIPSPRGRGVLKTALMDWNYLTHEPVHPADQVTSKHVLALARIHLRNFDEVLHLLKTESRSPGPRAKEALSDFKALANARKFYAEMAAHARASTGKSNAFDGLKKTYAEIRESSLKHLISFRVFHHQVPKEVSIAVTMVLEKYRENLPENMLAGETLAKMARARKS